jgi:hypothetical protein
MQGLFTGQRRLSFYRATTLPLVVRPVLPPGPGLATGWANRSHTAPVLLAENMLEKRT